MKWSPRPCPPVAASARLVVATGRLALTEEQQQQEMLRKLQEQIDRSWAQIQETIFKIAQQAGLDGVIDALKAAPGHTNSTLWKDVSDDASYLITSEWSDETAFQEFIRSDAFRAVTNWGKEQILSGRPQHKVYKH